MINEGIKTTCKSCGNIDILIFKDCEFITHIEDKICLNSTKPNFVCGECGNDTFTFIDIEEGFYDTFHYIIKRIEIMDTQEIKKVEKLVKHIENKRNSHDPYEKFSKVLYNRIQKILRESDTSQLKKISDFAERLHYN